MTNKYFYPIERLKHLLRQGWIGNIATSNIESIADHSLGVAFLAYVCAIWENSLREKSQPSILPLELSPSDLCAAGLIHDIAESQYMDFDKHLLDLVPEEAKKAKLQADTRGFQNITDIWREKTLVIAEGLERLIETNLSAETKSFINVIDALELHWQTLSYLEQGWLSSTRGKPFLESTYQKLLIASKRFLFLQELLKENLIVNNYNSL